MLKRNRSDRCAAVQGEPARGAPGRHRKSWAGDRLCGVRALSGEFWCMSEMEHKRRDVVARVPRAAVDPAARLRRHDGHHHHRHHRHVLDPPAAARGLQPHGDGRRRRVRLHEPRRSGRSSLVIAFVRSHSARVDPKNRARIAAPQLDRRARRGGPRRRRRRDHRRLRPAEGARARAALVPRPAARAAPPQRPRGVGRHRPEREDAAVPPRRGRRLRLALVVRRPRRQVARAAGVGRGVRGAHRRRRDHFTDKACIDQTRIDDNLACLPVHPPAASRSSSPARRTRSDFGAS